jgi:hypothetical protein
MKISINKTIFYEGLANGGITFGVLKDDAQTTLFRTFRTTGYVVSMPYYQLTAKDMTLDLFKAYVKMYDKAINVNRYIGIWLDTSTLTWYLDINNIYDRKIDAIECGIRNKQKAIYDLSNGETITL